LHERAGAGKGEDEVARETNCVKERALSRPIGEAAKKRALAGGGGGNRKGEGRKRGNGNAADSACGEGRQCCCRAGAGWLHLAGA